MEVKTGRGQKPLCMGVTYALVNPGEPPPPPQRLLDIPQPALPRDLEKFFVEGSGSASIPLKWLKPQTGTAGFYKVEVATSPFFVDGGKVIEHDQLGSTEFSASDLRPGVYFWRVRAIAPSGQTSDWSEPKKFIVATRGTGSKVPVSNLEAEFLGGQVYL